MEAVIRKWGNSLGIRIPNMLAKEFKLENGGAVDIIDSDGQIIIRPLKGKKKLLEKLSKITSKNIHAEFDTGERTGKEFW
ncbi:MAG: AbrB/MazE/SpoVT family DNA-binding domain-containing protein [Turneriella sp.]|nr:AbrB/MazE/SpoVT family DNA-binding domain-containing protein [Turneriella sp.]